MIPPSANALFLSDIYNINDDLRDPPIFITKWRGCHTYIEMTESITSHTPRNLSAQWFHNASCLNQSGILNKELIVLILHETCTPQLRKGSHVGCIIPRLKNNHRVQWPPSVQRRERWRARMVVNWSWFGSTSCPILEHLNSQISIEEVEWEPPRSYHHKNQPPKAILWYIRQK